MEFPDLGEQCSLPSCRQLDFLPFKCNACHKLFCSSHRTYANHDCPFAQTKIVPTCPLCERPVALMPGETADSAVTKHIDNNCDSDVAKQKREKLKANRCSLKGCKNKESLRVECNRCHLKFCLNHRHEMDHSCTGPRSAEARRLPVLSTVSRGSRPAGCNPAQQGGHFLQRSERPTALHVHSLQQPGISEDEALKRAIELSLGQSSGRQTNEDDEEARRVQDESDEALARALQEAEFSQQRTPVTTASDSGKQSCCVS